MKRDGKRESMRQLDDCNLKMRYFKVDVFISVTKNTEQNNNKICLKTNL